MKCFKEDKDKKIKKKIKFKKKFSFKNKKALNK